MVEAKRPRWNSGVSETIGFIIIFGIVLTGIGIVTLYGYPALLQEQANANIKNMEKNMLVLQSDLKSLTFKSVPYQETALQVSGGTLMIRKDIPNSPDFTIHIGGNSESFKPGELRYVSSDGQATLTLENGAVHVRYWSSPNGSAMLATPSWYYDSKLDTPTYVIQLIRINGSSDMAQTGIGTVRMQLEPDSFQSNPIPVTNSDYIEYNPNLANHYGVAWNNYLRNPDLQFTESSGKFYFKDGSQLIKKYYNVTFLSL